MDVMKTFDDIEVRRPELARSYLSLLEAQQGRPLALFAPRRIGKTFFLDHDLAPAAKASGMLPIYADLWLHKFDPLAAILHELEEALDDLSVPNSAVGKIAKTGVKKIGAMGASIDFGEEPRRRDLPDTPALRLDTLVARLARLHKGKILLMLDEAQSLVDAPDGTASTASLRAVLHKRRDTVSAVFTGSSQQGLAQMMNTAGTPMYQFAQMIDFPNLGEEFLRQLAMHFAKVRQGKVLDLQELAEAFQKIGFRPSIMRDIVKGMAAEGVTDVFLGIAQYMQSAQRIEGWKALQAPLDAFERRLLCGIAIGIPPLSKRMQQHLQSIPGAKPTIGKVRAALEKLKRLGLLSKHAEGIVIDDPLFLEYLVSTCD